MKLVHTGSPSPELSGAHQESDFPFTSYPVRLHSELDRFSWHTPFAIHTTTANALAVDPWVSSLLFTLTRYIDPLVEASYMEYASTYVRKHEIIVGFAIRHLVCHSVYTP